MRPRQPVPAEAAVPAHRQQATSNRPTQQKFHCVSCGHTAHADTVGAINVLNRAGLVRCNANTA
ncbi:zinc ribbon domain-containing protein [Streptomyces sp. NPDC054961]